MVGASLEGPGEVSTGRSTPLSLCASYSCWVDGQRLRGDALPVEMALVAEIARDASRAVRVLLVSSGIEASCAGLVSCMTQGTGNSGGRDPPRHGVSWESRGGGLSWGSGLSASF